MRLGTEVDLGLRDIGFDVEPATPRKKRHTHLHPIFDPCLLWPNGWMDEDAAWHGSRPRPRPHCTRRGPSSRERGTAARPPIFGPCLLWPRSPISATAELLSCFSKLSSMLEFTHFTSDLCQIWITYRMISYTNDCTCTRDATLGVSKRFC